MKVCTKCRIKKSLTSFTKDIQKKDGLKPSCKLCNKKGFTSSEKIVLRKKMIEKESMQICTKCNKKLPISEYRRDSSRISGYYPSCNDCLRVRTGAKKCAPIVGGRCYYTGYRKYILERDNYACVISGETINLHIHHIKTRGSGGTNEYSNLITLSDKVHREKAHGKDLLKYRKIFEDYTSRFTRPDFWDEVMNKSSYENDNTRKRINKRNNEYNKRKRDKLNKKFKEENNGLTYWQVQYRKNKQASQNVTRAVDENE